MDDALKTRDNVYLNVETWMLFASPIKISGYAPDRGRQWISSGAKALTRPTTWKVWPIHTSVFTAYLKSGGLDAKDNYLRTNAIYYTTSTAVLARRWYRVRDFMRRRDARVDSNHTMPNGRLLGKSCKQNSNILALNKTESIYI